MADSPISQLPAKTIPTTSDLMLITDVEDPTQSSNGSSKSLTLANLNTFLNNNLSFITASSVKTLTNTTYDTAGTGNSFKINGTAISAITGTGSVVLATSPQFAGQVGIGTPANAAIALTIDTGNDSHEGLVIFANSVTQSGLLLDIQNSAFSSKFNVDKSGNLNISGLINNLTLPAITDTIAAIAATQTFSNKRNTKRTTVTTQSATPTIDSDNTDVAYITGLAQAITSMTTNLSGTPNANDSLIVSITDNGTARAITWGSSFESSGNVTLPTTTVISTRLDVGFLWNVATSKWRCVGVA